MFTYGIGPEVDETGSDDAPQVGVQQQRFGQIAAVHTNGYQNKLLVASPCILYGITVFSSNVAAQWIQLFDVNGVPSSGANPDVSLTVAATANLGVYYGEGGRPFQRGLCVANSTTGPTYTAGVADTYFDVVVQMV